MGEPWMDAEVRGGRVVLVTDNVLSQAISSFAAVLGRESILLNADALDWLRSPDNVRTDDGIVLCDHDAPDVAAVLDAALACSATFVGMVGSPNRAASVFADYRERGYTEQQLQKLYVPVGLRLGGRSATEMGLSIIAQIVSLAYGKDGGPMKRSNPV
ncbi:MAG: XdhC family protein [Antricoccus sp.]